MPTASSLRQSQSQAGDLATKDRQGDDAAVELLAMTVLRRNGLFRKHAPPGARASHRHSMRSLRAIDPALLGSSAPSRASGTPVQSGISTPVRVPSRLAMSPKHSASALPRIESRRRLPPPVPEEDEVRMPSREIGAGSPSRRVGMSSDPVKVSLGHFVTPLRHELGRAFSPAKNSKRVRGDGFAWRPPVDSISPVSFHSLMCCPLASCGCLAYSGLFLAITHEPSHHASRSTSPYPWPPLSPNLSHSVTCHPYPQSLDEREQLFSQLISGMISKASIADDQSPKTQKIRARLAQLEAHRNIGRQASLGGESSHPWPGRRVGGPESRASSTRPKGRVRVESESGSVLEGDMDPAQLALAKRRAARQSVPSFRRTLGRDQVTAMTHARVSKAMGPKSKRTLAGTSLVGMRSLSRLTGVDVTADTLGAVLLNGDESSDGGSGDEGKGRAYLKQGPRVSGTSAAESHVGPLASDSYRNFETMRA